jgi:aspartate-semialdehyde dehydrogenase
MSAKIPVGILGATGMVGQRFIQLLEAHPWFEVTWLGASERSAGQRYREAVRWKMNTPIPARIAGMHVSEAEPAAVAKISAAEGVGGRRSAGAGTTLAERSGAPRVIFAALDAAIAQEMEPRFARAGHAVITNSSAFRMQEDVPLVIPEVNGDHLALLERQRWRENGGGFIVTNPNCSAIGLVMALAPLHERFGVEKVFVVTMQAVSGAGYPGVASLDVLGNVIPYIGKEEEKMEAESKKLLGSLSGAGIRHADFAISAQCNRVAVEDGHTESVSVKLRKPATSEEMIACWREYRGKIAELRLPSAPKEIVFYDEAPDHPQPRLDIHRGKGMTASVGRLRACNIFDWKFTVLSHNTIRGAAGAAILNAELLKDKGYIQ